MSYYHFRTAGPIWLKFLYCFSMVRNLVQVSRILGFPIGNKGVLRTTGDRGRFFADYGYTMGTHNSLRTTGDRGRFFADCGYTMGTHNSRTHLKIGDASL